jgi:nucleoid-associated protein YgaU
MILPGNAPLPKPEGHVRWLYRLLLGTVLLAGCAAKPPVQQLDAAEYLLARAYAHQAPQYATEEYHAAYAALEDARHLISAGSYPAAEAALTFARKHALQAYDVAEVTRERLAAEEEARRKAEEEARRKAEEEARRKAAEEARRKAEEEARRKAADEARRANEVRMLTEYQVGSGDTLASIAALAGVYRDPWLWPLLYQANRDQIKDPTLIYLGQTLGIPRNLSAAELEDARQRARDAGLFGLTANDTKPLAPR